MTQDTSTYYVWIGGSCDYGHKERAGGAAVVIEHNGNIISRDVISRSQDCTISQESTADRDPR